MTATALAVALAPECGYNTIRTVRLYGALGAKFGRVYHLAARNAAEAIALLSAQLPGFDAFMIGAKERGMGFTVFYGDRNLSQAQLCAPAGADEIRIAPVILGSKNGGLFNIILGAALIAVGALLSFTPFAALSPAFYNMGVAMIVGGITQLLAPAPKGIAAKDSPANTPSYAFNGAVNTQAQGNPCPLLYGRMIVGSATISAGIAAEDQIAPVGGSSNPGGGGTSRWNDEWSGTSIIQGAKGGSSNSRTPVETPDSLHSIAYARILDAVSEGEIEGFTRPDNPLSCVFYDETPVANGDGTLNFKNVQVDWRWGTQFQDYIKGFPSVENEIGVNVRLRQDTPWTRQLNNINLSAVRILISTPQFQSANTSNGDINGTRVTYDIAVSTDGGAFQVVLNGAFDGKTTTKYQRSHRVDLPDAQTGWQIRIRRLTADSSSSAVADETYIDSFTEIIDAKLRYPMTALISNVVDASQFQNVPTRSYDLLGRIIKVPSNYDPVARTYAGIWDGTFKLAWTNNPAWIFYDLATNTRYGRGRFVRDSQINKAALYRAARYCDEMVPDGRGGYEPRFTCNLYLQRAAEAAQVMQDVATVFRGISYAAAGEIVAVPDMPEDPAYLYNQANVKDGAFKYSGTGRKARHTVAVVSWVDLDDFGRAKVEFVDDPDGIARYGYQPTEVIAIGCTSRAQAQRFGRYLLATERFETDTVNFEVGLDGTLVPPGKVFEVADPKRKQRRTGGRIRNATAASITPDLLPVLNVGDRLSVVLPTGTVETREVASIDAGTIHVDPPFSAAPIPHAAWTINEVGPQSFRMLSVRDKDDRSGYEVTALQHVREKFDYVDFGIKIDDPTTTPVPGRTQSPPMDLAITHRQFAAEVIATTIVTMSWSPPSGAIAYEVEWRSNGSGWTKMTPTGATSVEVDGIRVGPFDFRVVAVNASGVKSAPALLAGYIVPDQTNPPGVIVDLQTGLEVVEEIGLDNQEAIAEEIINRQVADAAEAQARADAITAEAQARAEAILAEAQARGTAITNEQTLREQADQSLAAQITLITAGANQQFDYKQIWYFDQNAEGWTSNTGTPVVASGWIKPADGTAPYLVSPAALGVSASTYAQMMLRIRKVGTPTWAGRLWWQEDGQGSWDPARSIDVVEPTYDASGIAVITVTQMGWSGTVNRVRVDAIESQDADNYVEVDWVAVGRPAPGASTAALQQEASARATGDIAEATARETLAAQLRGTYNGTDVSQVSSGLLFSERTARAAADSAQASRTDGVEARLETAEGSISQQATAIDTLETSVTDLENENSSQANQLTSLTSRVAATESTNAGQATAITNLQTRVTANEDGLTEQAASLTAIKAGLGGSGNLLQNASFDNGTAGISGTAAGVFGAAAIDYAGDSWHPPGIHSIGRNTGATLTPNDLQDMALKAVAVTEGKRYCASVYMACHRARAYFYIKWVDATGATLRNDLSDVLIMAGAGGVGSGGQNLNNWVRKFIFQTAPANAVSAIFYLRSLGNDLANPYTWFLRPMLEEAGALQTAPSPWNEGANGTAANAAATTALEARVTTTEGNVTSISSAVTQLQSSANENKFQSGLTWEFIAANTGNPAYNGFTVANASLASFPVTSNFGATAISSTTSDPNFISPVISISGKDNPVVRALVRRRQSTAWEGRLFWSTGSHSFSSTYSTISAPTPAAGGDWTLVEWDMSAVDDWRNSTITRLRFDFDTGTSTIDVRWIGIGSTTSGPSASAKATTLLQTSVDSLTGKVNASYSLVLNANNYIVGWKFLNDGQTGTLDFLLDQIRFISPSGGARTEYSNGNWRVYDAAGVLRVRMGIW